MKRMYFVMMLCALLFACKPEAEKPTVVTTSVEDVTETTAKVVGQVTADGGVEVTERGVCWNTESNPEITNQRTVDGTGLGMFTSEVADLEPNTTYYVRAYATNEKGTSYGDEKSFKTQETEEPDDDEPEIPVVVIVTTSEVTDITINSAVCGGEIAIEGEIVIVARGVCYGANPNPTLSDSYTTDGEGVGAFTSQLSDLTHGTTYYVRAYATDEDGNTSYGEEKSFVTLEMLIPAVTTSEVTDITMSSAVCGGEVTSDGNVVVTSRGVCWSTEQNPTIEDSKTTDGDGVGVFTSNITELSQGTTYYVRAYAVNEIGIAYGEEVIFTTNGYEWVDLGLPSGLKWATCNVGASSPEDCGDYFAWGETSPKAEYNVGNSVTYGEQMSDFSGNPQYDAATANWGGGWRIPTKDEMIELVNNCEWEWMQVNGVYGARVVGPNGNCIFLPAAGVCYGSLLYDEGKYGIYWSSTPNDKNNDNAYNLYLDGANEWVYCNYYRSTGLPVRPIAE